MAFQDAVIEYKVGKEVIFINQDTFLSGFKAESIAEMSIKLEYVSLLKSLSAGIIHSFAVPNSADGIRRMFIADSADGNRRIGSMNSALNVCRIWICDAMYCVIGSFSCG